MLKSRVGLKGKIAILVLISLLTSCSTPVGCSSFHQIRNFSDQERKFILESIEKSILSREWFQDVADFKETYKENCE